MISYKLNMDKKMKLSEKMINAGWVIKRERNGSFTVYGSGAQEYRFDAQKKSWSEPLQTIELSLEQDLGDFLKENSAAGKSPLVISSRLTALNHTKQLSQPVRYLCQKGLPAGKSILHLGTGMDRFAEDALMKAGCTSVFDYDPNFFPDTSVLENKYDIVMAHYVLNILPPEDRRKVYDLIFKTLHRGGSAYMTVQGVWPVEHKYDILKPLEDGYLIKTGFNITFRKGYSEEEFLREIKAELGGNPKVLTTFYSNTLAVWKKNGN